MGKNLVIVESPAKAKTIEGFLGKDYLVKSSFGHIRDLSKKKLGVDVDDNFKPDYEISPDKTKVIRDLKKLAKDAETVWLASDEDREGEAIAWHLQESLGLKESQTKRIVFHEITKNAILDAVQNPRSIDINLVNAQQARRVLDRLVGFELSPVLWKKVKPSLSAGRVQSVAVRLIVERENEIKDFTSKSSFKISGIFYPKGETISAKNSFSAELPSRFDSKDDAENFLKLCVSSDFSITDIEKKPAKKSPAPPFTTSTLQQEASRKLSFSVSKTMLVAQQLYESGKITYMRTDSVNLSNMALGSAHNEIESIYGAKYAKTRKYATKSKGAQEAHEAIRPTYINNHTAGENRDQQRLYELIWKRTIASQMSDAELERTSITIDVSKAKQNFVAKGEVIKFDGFLKVYLESRDDEDAEEQKGVLPQMAIRQVLMAKEITAQQRFSQHLPRYTEASLVRKLEELGIGRPSTYAPIISTIQKREYVVKEDRDGVERQFVFMKLSDGTITDELKTEKTGYEKGKLFPTDIGKLVNEFLVRYFDKIMDYNFTASVEQQFDKIAEGTMVWQDMLKTFYGPFHANVEDTLENSEKVKGERILGVDPASNKNVIARIGRFGPMIQLGEADPDSEEKPRFAGMKKNQSIETISLEEALELLKFPRVLGSYEDAEMTVAVGRFGPYVRHKSKFFSLAKTDDPAIISAERAVEIIIAKREQEAKALIKEFEEDKEIKVKVGRYGPYVSKGKKNYRIPKTVEPEKLSYEDCLKLIEEGDKGKSKTASKKPAAKKTTTKKTTTKKRTTKKTESKKK